MARGAVAEAEPLQRRALDAYERQLGPEHRETLAAVGNLASVLRCLGKFSEAPLLRAASSHGRVAFCGGQKMETIAGQSSQNLSFISMNISMHEHVNFTQIISNHYTYYTFCHYMYIMYIFMDSFWKCQSLTKVVCKEQMPRCKFQFEMSEAVKAF